MDPLCYLLYVSVLFCDPVAQQYTDAASTVPPEHWQLIKWVGIQDAPTGRASPDGVVLLPYERKGGVLRHEVGHMVAYSNDHELGRLFELIFWYEGQPRWRTPTRYARKSPAEDFAESYRFFIEGRLAGCCPERARWLRERVPYLAEYEGVRPSELPPAAT